MSTDVRRYVEVYTEDISGTISNHKQINKLGNLKVGDVVMCYNTKHHYRRIKEIDKSGKFVYEIIEEPKDLKEALNFRITPDFTVESEKHLPTKNVPFVKDSIYRAWGNGTEYYKMDSYDPENGITWVKTEDVPKSWKTVKWTKNNGEMNFHYTSGFNIFCRMFVSERAWESIDENFANRGTPPDVTPLVKKDLEDGYGTTYCSYAELKKRGDIVLNRFKSKLVDILNKENMNEINQRLEYIMKYMTLVKRPEFKLVNNDTDEYDDEPHTFSDVYDDDVWDVIVTMNEIERIDAMLDCADMHASWDNIRIIYQLC